MNLGAATLAYVQVVIDGLNLTRAASLAAVVVACLGLSACLGKGADIMEAHGTRESRRLDLVLWTCNAADLSARVEETSSRVTVTVTARGDTSDDCADGYVVMLEAPLGDRELVDGGTGAVVAVQPP